MENNNCHYCKEKIENCICSLVAKFFGENGHLMETENGIRREQEKTKFFYVKNVNPLVIH